MATYMLLFSFTQQGMEKVRESPARVEAAKQTVRTLGGEVTAFYAMLGSRHDTMFIIEAPNDEKVAEMALTIGALGNVRTMAHRLFNEKEFARVVSSLT